MNDINIEQLAALIDNLYYFSEEEHPVVISEIEAASVKLFKTKVANLHAVDEFAIQFANADSFFTRFEEYISFGNTDELLYQNALRFLLLRDFLMASFESVHLLRVPNDNGAVINIYLVFKTADAIYQALHTIAVET